MAMWDGRFEKEIDSRTNDFNSSIKFDYKMYKQDIKGSIAHAKMLSKQKIIEKEDEIKIVEGLKEKKSSNIEKISILEKYEESSKQIHEIMSELFAEKYEINSDLVEARSAAIVASIIFDEIMEGTD